MQCITSGEEYIAQFQAVLAGAPPATCVDPDLMVSIQNQNKDYSPSPTLKLVLQR
jgi:hypothetical protein